MGQLKVSRSNFYENKLNFSDLSIVVKALYSISRHRYHYELSIITTLKAALLLHHLLESK